MPVTIRECQQPSHTKRGGSGRVHRPGSCIHQATLTRLRWPRVSHRADSAHARYVVTAAGRADLTDASETLRLARRSLEEKRSEADRGDRSRAVSGRCSSGSAIGRSSSLRPGCPGGPKAQDVRSGRELGCRRSGLSHYREPVHGEADAATSRLRDVQWPVRGRT